VTIWEERRVRETSKTNTTFLQKSSEESCETAAQKSERNVDSVESSERLTGITGRLTARRGPQTVVIGGEIDVRAVLAAESVRQTARSVDLTDVSGLRTAIRWSPNRSGIQG
jgi:hypothetical protein